MSQIKFLDSYASIGKWWDKDPDHPWTVERMLKDMERCQIHGALIYSNLAKELQPSVGNEEVIRVCEKHPRLIPAWVVLPDQCGDVPKTAQLIREIKDKNVKAVKIFPRLHRYPVDERTLGNLFRALEEAEIPLMIDNGEANTDFVQISWQEVGWICQNYPNLKVILHSVRWEATRSLLPILKEFPNLFVEFSNYQANRIIDFLVEQVGADQLLFGTQMMLKSPGAAKAFIDYADISEQDRRKIAGENLIRILKLEQIPEDYPDDRTDDKILIKARRGEPIDDMEVIDSHAHHYPKNHFDNAIAFMPKSDAAGIVERNRCIGVNITCSSPWVGIWSDWEMGNLNTRDAIKELPDEFIGYAVFDPRYVNDWESELKKCYEKWGMKGMKPYFPRNHIPYNDPVYNRWYEYGNRKRLFALMHWSDNFDQEMDDLARRFPEISFLLAHSGMSYERAKRHIRLAKKFKNIHLEITYTAVTNGIIEYMVDQVGASRVIYGSDAAMRDPIPQFGWVAYADISEEEKRLILGKNMRKIIDRVLLK
ncbi:MAG: amidohydrolase family protein [Calditrichaeota bacterium]|nr:amidohydrolase family protein [Calditrichota bacterium]